MMDAVETAERIKRKELSPREAIDAAIDRAQAAKHLGAIVTEMFEQARSAAPTNGPLAGVPTFIKDLAQVGGVVTTWGSRGGAACVSKKHDPFIKKLLATGMICLGKSTTPELGLTATTEPLGREPTRNPWDPARSAGGSSGGAAALVAAGVVPIAHASDGGGSIRIPAACCGLVGFKPTRGLMDMEGSRLLPVNIATHGAVTRTVRDTIAFHDALAPAPMPALGQLRIGVFTDSPRGTPVHEETKSAVRAAAKLLESLGHRVDEIGCPFSGQVIDDFLEGWGMVSWLQVKTARMLMHRKFDVAQFEPWTLGLAQTFTSNRRKVIAAMRRLRKFGKTYAQVMQSYDVLVSPTTAEPAPLLGYLATDQPFETKYDRIRSYCPFTPPMNVAGTPAISLPLGRSKSGLPIGVQFAAARGADRLLLALAQTIEEAQPWVSHAQTRGR